MKVIFAVASLLLFPLSAIPQQFDPASIENSIVQIAVVLPDKSVEVEGTGFLVGDGTTVISAGQVYRDAQKIISDRKGGDLIARKFSSVDSNQFQVPISFTKANDSDDLIALSLDKTSIQQQWPSLDLKGLPLSTSDADPSDAMVALGYDETYTLATPYRVHIIGFAKFSADVEEAILTIELPPGDRGSARGTPVVRTRDRSVVGVILSVGAQGADPVTLAAKVSRVRSLLN